MSHTLWNPADPPEVESGKEAQMPGWCALCQHPVREAFGTFSGWVREGVNGTREDHGIYTFKRFHVISDFQLRLSITGLKQ